MRFHIGIDDTDSLAGGCTTKIAADLVYTLSRKGASFLDYPDLIRLNPNVPWKTRGNGAVCLRIDSDIAPETILELAVEEIERGSRLGDPGTDPGVVVLEGGVPSDVVEFGREALTRIVNLGDAMSVIRRVNARAIGCGSGQGIIGALGAIGTLLDCDYTYELIAYRSKGFIGKRRLIDETSVSRMSETMKEVTFNNIDPETGRILITPRGPDPILCGVRGESAEAVRNAFEMLDIREPIEAWMIFRTNQGTDAHLIRNVAVSELQDNCAVIVEGTVKQKARTIPGGHVIFVLEDQTGLVHCAAYEPTGRFREIVKKLEPGDRVRGFGGVRAAASGIPRTVNLEKLEILELVVHSSSQNPVCPKCGKRMKSAGRGQDFRCRHCKSHAPSKIRTEIARDLCVGKFLPPPRAHRHLTKPCVRYQRGQRGSILPPMPDWRFP
jgi:tRNA(Ile2)-agmatinylcytidine synthase